MELVNHIRFDDLEQNEFKKIASVSILCDKSVESEKKKGGSWMPRLTIVHRARQGDLLSPQAVAELVEALEDAIEDRHQVVADMNEAGHPELARAAEQWYPALRRCLELAEQAREWVGEYVPDEDEANAPA